MKSIASVFRDPFSPRSVALFCVRQGAHWAAGAPMGGRGIKNHGLAASCERPGKLAVATARAPFDSAAYLVGR